jgi:hypothetical protein
VDAAVPYLEAGAEEGVRMLVAAPKATTTIKQRRAKIELIEDGQSRV